MALVELEPLRVRRATSHRRVAQPAQGGPFFSSRRAVPLGVLPRGSLVETQASVVVPRPAKGVKKSVVCPMGELQCGSPTSADRCGRAGLKWVGVQRVSVLRNSTMLR